MRFLIMLAAGFSLSCFAAEREVVTWAGNTLEWNERLGVTLLRQGCSETPAACVDRMAAAAASQRVDRWALAIKGDARKTEADALEYSALSLRDPRLVEIDIDDFLGAMKSWHLGTFGRANGALATIIGNTKSRNPRLRFGITVYEDELDSPVLAAIPSDTRARVDRVSLFLHYRENAGDFPKYVAEVRRLFPRADIWAGSYAYDRIDYLPCAEGGDRHCSVDEELRLYRQSLSIQLGLLEAAVISGIEFYPGHFGLEDTWHGWKRPRICDPTRVPQCIATTRRLRNISSEMLAATKARLATP